jgi:hypothetical protein
VEGPDTLGIGDELVKHVTQTSIPLTTFIVHFVSTLSKLGLPNDDIDCNSRSLAINAHIFILIRKSAAYHSGHQTNNLQIFVSLICQAKYKHKQNMLFETSKQTNMEVTKYLGYLLYLVPRRKILRLCGLLQSSSRDTFLVLQLVYKLTYLA